MRRARGLTLIEVMISVAILAVMMTLAWMTISNASDSRKRFELYEERNHEVRMATARIVADFERAYISKNEDPTQQHPRTMFQGKSGSNLPDLVRFSTMGHHVLFADANESEQTVIQYLPHENADGGTDWIRREQRRQSNQPPEEEPADYDILLSNVKRVKLEYYNWKTTEWQDTWDTTQADGQKGYLPQRVKITIEWKGPDGVDQKIVTEARILMQEQLTSGVGF
ncbi:MAG TPA: type II secretion system protein GspJ [Kofleriaceae bacterium]|jgi:general secretion pathway protein J